MFSRSNFAQFMQSNKLCLLCSLKRNALLSCNTYSLVSTVKNKLLAVRCDVVTEKCSTINRLHLQLFTVYIFAPLRVDSFGVCNLYYFSFSSLHLEYRNLRTCVSLRFPGWWHWSYQFPSIYWDYTPVLAHNGDGKWIVQDSWVSPSNCILIHFA